MKIKLFTFNLILLFSLSHLNYLLGQSSHLGLYKEQSEIYLKKAETLNSKGQIQQAILYIKQAQALFEEQKEEESYVESWLTIAKYLESTPTSPQRVYAIKQAVSSSKQRLNNDHKFIIQSLQLMGELYIDQNKLDSAQLVISEAISIGERAEHWDDLAWILIVDAVIHYYKEDFKRMGVAIQRADSIAASRIKEPSEHFEYITTMQSILFDATGDYEKAFISSKKTLNRNLQKKKLLKSDSIALANAYNNHAAITYDRGDYEQAFRHYKIALNLHKEIKSEKKILIAINNNLILSLKQASDGKQSRFYINSNQRLLSPEPNDNNYKEWLLSHHLLAEHYMDNLATDSANILLKKIIPLSKKYNYLGNQIYLSLGKIYLKKNQPKNALLEFKKSADFFDKKHGKKHPDIAQINRWIGISFREQSQLDSALFYFQKSVFSLSQDSSYKSKPLTYNPELNTINAFNELLKTLEEKSKTLARLASMDSKWTSSAIKTYRLAIATIDIIRKKHETTEAKLTLSKTAKKIYEGSIKILFSMYSKNQDKALLKEAFQYAEKSKSLLLLEKIWSIEARHFNKTIPINHFQNFLKKGEKTNAEIIFFEQKLLEFQQEGLPPNHPKIETTEIILANKYQIYLEWKDEMKVKHPQYYDLKYDKNFESMDTIQKHLLNLETVLLEYFIGSESSFLFVISQDAIKFLKLSDYKTLISANRVLQNSLQDHLASIQNIEKAYFNYNKTAYNVFNLLLKEALNTLSPDVKKLIIIPDDFVNNIPFEALNIKLETQPSISFGGLPYLLYDFKIHYGYSANLLLTNRKSYNKIDPNINCLALAVPSIQDKSQINRSPVLKGSIQEIQYLANNFSGYFDYSTVVNEALFKQKVQDFGILHLAMHGVANFDNPNFAYLKFPDLHSDSLEDNYLYEHEIANINFNAQLATLSACETGKGVYIPGEGVFSLARSFMHAGVPSVVTGLWNINDQSTSMLMSNFYKNLKQGFEKDEALQIAKKDFLKEADLVYQHPYYWSGIILLGEEQPLKKKAKKNWWWLIGFSFLGSLVFFFKKTNLVHRVFFLLD